jgi:hypothetical protein
LMASKSRLRSASRSCCASTSCVVVVGIVFLCPEFEGSIRRQAAMGRPPFSSSLRRGKS